MRTKLLLGLRHAALFGGFFLAIWIVQMVWGVAWTLGGRALGLPETLRGSASRLGILAIQVALAWWVLGRWGSLDLRATGFAQHNGWLGDLLVGLALGTVAMAALYGIYRAAGWLTMHGWVAPTLAGRDLAGRIWFSVVTCTVAAVGEEALFRGFLFAGLDRHWGFWPAALASSLPFGALHLLVSTARTAAWWAVLLGVSLAGVMLCWLYWRAGSLWLPIGVHFSWNLVQSDGLNLVGDSGNPNLFGANTTLGGPPTLVGSAYGIETGALVILAVAMVLTGAWLWMHARRPRRPWRDAS